MIKKCIFYLRKVGCNELTAINLLFFHCCDFCQLFYTAVSFVSNGASPDAELMRGISITVRNMVNTMQS